MLHQQQQQQKNHMTTRESTRNCPIGTPTWFLQVCRFARCPLEATTDADPVRCVDQQPETAWLYQVLRKSQIAHGTLVSALYYLSLITLQSLREGAVVKACDLSSQRQQQSSPRAPTTAMLKQAATCPHCLLTGCMVAAHKALQFSITNSPSSTQAHQEFATVIAEASTIPIEIVQFCEYLAVNRLQERLAITTPVMEQLLTSYVNDPIRKHWWASEEDLCYCWTQNNNNITNGVNNDMDTSDVFDISECTYASFSRLSIN